MPPRPTCECGTCPKCWRREYMRQRRAAMTPEQRAAARGDRTAQRHQFRDWAERNRERLREIQRAYREAHREQVRETVARYKARNPEKLRAQRALAYAVETGRIERELCEVCGAAAEAHHDDYAKPLNVRWLCRKHHRAVHRMAA